jgi:hypothetical protein
MIDCLNGGIKWGKYLFFELLKVFVHTIHISYKNEMHEFNPKVHYCIAHFSLWNHTLWSWQILLNGRKYSDGNNEMFCEDIEEIFESKYVR